MGTIKMDYSPELFEAVMENMIDYYALGETVCGAEDPAVISVTDELGRLHPELAGLTTVRVTEKYVSAWKSDTFLEFSSQDITDDEYAQYGELRP